MTDTQETILRNPLRERYTILSTEMLEDERLSLEAKGVLAYLFSRPDGWVIRQAQLCKLGSCGHNRMTRIFRELRACGYVEVVKPRDDRGRVVGTEIKVVEQPRYPITEIPKNRDSEKPRLGKQVPLSKTDSLSNTDSLSKRERPPKRKPETEIPENFKLTESMLAYCQKKAPGIDPYHQFEKFHNHHQAKGTRFRSWEAAWRTWVLNAAKWEPQQPEPPRRISLAEAAGMPELNRRHH